MSLDVSIPGGEEDRVYILELGSHSNASPCLTFLVPWMP